MAAAAVVEAAAADVAIRKMAAAAEIPAAVVTLAIATANELI